MDRCIIKANAKINLSLDVTGKRSDGYHSVRMIMQAIDLHDTVTVSLSGKGISIESDSRMIPLDGRNLACKAAELFLREFGIDCGVKIRIAKKIPIAAGLAGGSTDAAAVLSGLNRLLAAGLDTKRLCELGSRLGADVPFCISGGTMLAEGIGDVLTRLPGFSGVNLIIVRPRINVSTQWVYGNFKPDVTAGHPDTGLLLKAVESRDIKALAANMVNVLETVTINEFAEIGQIKNKLVELGSVGSLMSGSGPSVFGIFLDRHSAKKAWNLLDRKGFDCFLAQTL